VDCRPITAMYSEGHELYSSRVFAEPPSRWCMHNHCNPVLINTTELPTPRINDPIAMIEQWTLFGRGCFGFDENENSGKTEGDECQICHVSLGDLTVLRCSRYVLLQSSSSQPPIPLLLCASVSSTSGEQVSTCLCCLLNEYHDL
jgi:hypothetical protein